MTHSRLEQTNQIIRRASPAKGFSLLEMLTAFFILTFGVLALVPLVPLTTRQNDISRYQTTATIVGERLLEQMGQQAFTPPGGFFDRAGNWIQVSCAAPAQESCGNPLTEAGRIDFSLAPLAGFSLSYQDPRGVSYNVRWNVQRTPSNTKQFVVGVRARSGALLVPPVQLRTLFAP